MFIRRSIEVVGKCAACVILMLALVPVGIGQTMHEQEDEPEIPDTIDEIVVYGDKSLNQLRREFFLAEENFLAVFNTLNSNDEFDIECEYVVNLGSRRRHHLCMPNFAIEAQADANEATMATAELTGYRLWEYHPNSARVKKKDELLWKEMSALVSKDPELRQAFIDLARAKQIYESEREQRCDGQGFFCGR